MVAVGLARLVAASHLGYIVFLLVGRFMARRWIHDYDCHRHHTAVEDTPASRVKNLCGHYS